MEEGGEEVSPDVSLEVRVDEVAAVEGAADGSGGEVEGVVVGGGSGGGGGDEPFLGGEGTEEAVWEDGGRVALAAQAGLDEAASVVQNHHRIPHNLLRPDEILDDEMGFCFFLSFSVE